MQKNIIVACDLNNAIGKNNTLPWKLKKDLEFFKSITINSTVIMGRKTFESIGKPLPKRHNIVISRTLEPIAGVIIAKDIQSAIDTAESLGEDIYFIGGAEIYNQCLHYCSKIFMTKVYTEVYEPDTFFPGLSSEWLETSRVKYEYPDENNEYPFDIITLEYL